MTNKKKKLWGYITGILWIIITQIMKIFTPCPAIVCILTIISIILYATSFGFFISAAFNGWL
jgi:hypothetical protein